MKNITLILFIIPFLSFGQWTQIGNTINGEFVNDQLGYAIDINADGTIIAAGEPYNDSNGSASGRVRIFEEILGEWTQKGQSIEGISAADTAGFSISLSDSGNIVAIGAPDENTNGFESGQVRIFEFQAGDWTQIGDNINGEAFSDHSGFSISISGNGNVIAIGAPDNEGTEGGNFGHVRVYENIAGHWQMIGADIDGEAAEDNSGYAVSLNYDGSILAIGAPFNDDSASSAGHVRVYENQANNWIQIGNDIDGLAQNDRFGSAISINAEGNIIAIGAWDHNSIGQVRIFINQSGEWEQIGDDINGDNNLDRFGYAISINAQGDVLAIGAPRNDDSAINAGHVKVYQYQSNVWQQIDEAVLGENVEDRSGFSVSLNSDGSILAIGTYLNDNSGQNAGAVSMHSNSNILSLNNNSYEENIIIYPNPSTTHVTIDLGIIMDTIIVEVYDSTGKLIKTQSFNNSKTAVVLTENFANGVYYIKIETKYQSAYHTFLKR